MLPTALLALIGCLGLLPPGEEPETPQPASRASPFVVERCSADGAGAIGRFLANVLLITVFLNLTYNATGGKLTVAFLVHRMLSGVYPWKGGADVFTGQVVVSGAAALALLLVLGPRWLDRTRAATRVFPGDDRHG